MNRFAQWAGIVIVIVTLAGCGGSAAPATTASNATTGKDGAAPAIEVQTSGATTVPVTWLTTPLQNVKTGESIKLMDFVGKKAVLVEMMAVWCTNCLQQQNQIKALHQKLGPNTNWISVDVDVDPNEDAPALKAYIEKQGFDWTYVVAPAAVSREISNLYGVQFLNPTAVPMLIVDNKGQAHPLPFGIKSADTLEQMLAPYLQ